MLKIRQLKSDERISLRKLKLQETGLLLDFEKTKLIAGRYSKRKEKARSFERASLLLCLVRPSGLEPPTPTMSRHDD
ncbi:hypothetical protein [Photobacterium galatheae]|uniref:Uncharacterized protein n=1 Tax=Photobacterium galatheae TaxID=1654360 RepID=A0A066RKS3_9GAMM|nr:hypothetical protein [Photobacterium galatheae]KDM89671.1 hypothetical protein EA58_21340 [Photobacterium galatheae]